MTIEPLTHALDKEVDSYKFNEWSVNENYVDKSVCIDLKKEAPKRRNSWQLDYLRQRVV